jgi:hypothetical protein
MMSLQTKLALMKGCEAEARDLKEALRFQELSLRAHEQELAQMVLKPEVSDCLASADLYLVGRQLSKALDKIC